MKRLLTAVLMTCAAMGLAFADTPSATAPAKSASTSDSIKQIEHDWTEATIAGDFDKVGQIIADDWAGISFDGSKMTKQGFLADLKSGKDKAQSVEIGPMDVKVLGNVAIVQGSDTEKSITNGKDSSGKWVWMDVFVKRDGKWVAVRSQAARVAS
ncbi:MAG TPA: nuclear transport factor 2 family protein [Steroidobacteraceae bacterium]